MKKIKQSLQNLNLGEDRILNRKELKQIAGGNGSPCSIDDDCPEGLMCIDGNCEEPGSDCASRRCGGGDKFPWSVECAKMGTSSLCICPSSAATWSNCLG